MHKRQVIETLGALGLMALAPHSIAQKRPAPKGLQKAKVVVVGAGYGGLSAAKYLRRLSGNLLDVTLVEMQPKFVSSPLSNLVLSGHAKLEDITLSYEGVAEKFGITFKKDRAIRIDTAHKWVQLQEGPPLPYDKLILSPGVSFDHDAVEGLEAARALGQCLQAWSNNGELSLLRQQLLELPNGGIFALTIPESPYKCPPAPYERACQVASYFKKHKPKCQVLVLDANDNVVSNAQQFKRFWSEHYSDHIQYHPNHKLIGVQDSGLTLSFEVQDDLSVNLANVLPPMRAGTVAKASGLVNVNDKWCGVRFLDFQSEVAQDVHILGDAIQAASLMPKSAHMAHAQALVVSSAIVNELSDQAVNQNATLDNICFSFLDDRQAIHIASKHHFDASEQTFLLDENSSNNSQMPSASEGELAWKWAHDLWHDMLN
jgi:NADH dehydrogenase FAD-containing subunit